MKARFTLALTLFALSIFGSARFADSQPATSEPATTLAAIKKTSQTTLEYHKLRDTLQVAKAKFSSSPTMKNYRAVKNANGNLMDFSDAQNSTCALTNKVVNLDAGTGDVVCVNKPPVVNQVKVPADPAAPPGEVVKPIK